ncbi:uncharacterized protein LOC103477511 isoform X2 [Poecilia reticulata]|uniref:uncharacterized protein LOC103477511 isoform X2 n=1 Tax=Poecilia reticulata TaxID=8081 RepID=UPI0004A362A3|nr:PREDICTED: uncharacterized protein LOC103477511 isoform X2 [Poecilia reticulata]
MRGRCRISERKHQQQVELMASQVELLLVTLGELSPRELVTFSDLLRRWCCLRAGEALQAVVYSVVLIGGRRSVELTQQVLKSMNRTDLVDAMQDGSSTAKKKRFDDLQSAEIHRVSAVAVMKDLLLEILTDLKEVEFWKFKWFLQLTQFQQALPQVPWSALQFANRTQLVGMMWASCGERCLALAEEVLMDLDRSDLVEKLPLVSSSAKGKRCLSDLWPDLKQKVKDVESVIKLLLEELEDVTVQDVTDIRNALSWDSFHCPYLSLCWRLLGMNADLQETVLLLVQTFSQRPVDKMEELLSRMQRPDLVFALIRSTEKKHVVGKRKSALMQKVATMAAVKSLLLETFNRLNRSEFQQFKQFLQPTVSPEEFPHTRTWSPAEIQNRTDLVTVLVEEEGAGSVERTRRIFRVMNRADLLQMLPGSSTWRKATSTEVDPSGSGSVEQDSSSWTKVDPELDGTSPDQDPTYSLQSAAGHFECSVSGLRWVCREKVGFRYRFCSWDGHMERMESRGFRPAGPLLDISVLTGRVMEVQLPHWVCTDDVPELLKNFAVLHVNDCGDVLEKATRVTKTHVGLAEPVFSLLGAVIKYFFNPRISCNTLMYYQPKTSYLKMRVYLIPPDPALKQSVHSRESSKGYEEIVKPRPDKPLKMGCGFSLQATVETARIQPPEITLRHESQDPNFYEVFIENPGENFNLELLQTHSEKVWFCEIRKDDHPRSGSTEAGCSTETVTVKKEEEHFVDKHRETLIQRVRNIGPVLDGLLQKKVLLEETYNQIRSLPTSESQLREIFSCLRAADGCKDIFLSILQEKESYLIADLQSKC